MVFHRVHRYVSVSSKWIELLKAPLYMYIYRSNDLFCIIWRYTDTYIYRYIYMTVSHLFLYMELTPVVPIVCGMSFAWYLVSVMCGIESVLCAGSSLRCMRGLVCIMCVI